MNEATESTSGSWTSTSASARCRSIMRANDTSGAASETPRMSPVSSMGKKPLGTIIPSQAVSAIVPTVVTSVAKRWRSTHFRVRS